MILSQVKIDENDEKFISLKNRFLLDLKENVLCDDHDPIIA
jgi:hypothetical protein